MMLSHYLGAFIVGGIWCLIAQIILDKTKLTPANILVGYVVIGAILTAFNWYDIFLRFGHAGATVPIPGFGYSLAKGAIKGAQEKGIIGIFTGGLSATSGGVASIIFFGYIIALVCNPKTKE